MKRYSEIKEMLDLGKPGNGLGLTNRYTPISNVITNVKNYFGATYNIVVTEGSNNSIELRCSRWINVDEAYKDLSCINVGGKTIASYIYEQGLGAMKLILEGQRIIAVFYAPDIKNDTTKALNNLPDASEYTDFHANENGKSQTSLIYTDSHANENRNSQTTEDCEIISWYNIKDGILIEGKDDDSELEDQTPKEIRELIVSDNKVKAVEKFAELMNQQMDLPADYYWKAVKDKDGNESIALRHKKEKRRPFGKKAEVVDSIINIYGEGDEAIWVDGYDDIDNMPDDMKNLIENILNILGAEKTDDVCVYSLKELGSTSDENEDNNKEDDNVEDDDSTLKDA